MSATATTEAYVQENLPSIEREIQTFEQKQEETPALVLLLAESNEVVAVSLDTLNALRKQMKAHPVMAEILARHASGAYLGKDGKAWDVPIVCKSESIYTTSLATLKATPQFGGHGANSAAGSPMLTRSATTLPSGTAPVREHRKAHHPPVSRLGAAERV